MDSEDQLVNRIRHAMGDRIATQREKTRPGRVSIGIGDDAAVITPRGKTDWVLSCDSFMEGVHFWADRHPAESVGYKSLVRATSDLAAMGATPAFFLLTLALPSKRTHNWLDGFLKGLRNAATQLKISLIGGDTTRFPAISISITVLGEISCGMAICRSGAQPGDLIYVSNRLGRAQLGLELLRRGVVKDKDYSSLLQPHLYPTIAIKLGAWLAQRRIPSAMMDISDGLSTDLARLCSSSGVGAQLFADRIPSVRIPVRVPKMLPKVRLDPLAMALHGGEDYQLLFTVPPRKVKLLRRAPEFAELTAVGAITRKRNLVIVSTAGRERPLQPQGWDPFRG